MESTDSEDNEKPSTLSLATIVQMASNNQPDVQLNGVQAARLDGWLVFGVCNDVFEVLFGMFMVSESLMCDINPIY